MVFESIMGRMSSLEESLFIVTILILATLLISLCSCLLTLWILDWLLMALANLADRGPWFTMSQIKE